MALPWWIETAKNNLYIASNDYAEIQKQLDRYNKIFEVYANANPETQMRAASVMRQAINEYNWLKRQQEENALKIYEAKQWVNYYNTNNAWTKQPATVQTTKKVTLSDSGPVERIQVVEEVPVVNTETPWAVNENNNVTMIETEVLDNNAVAEVPYNETFATVQSNNTVKKSVPKSVTNYVNSQTPKYQNTTIGPTTNYSYTWNSYGAGSVAGFNSTPGYTSSWRKSSSNNLLGSLIRKWAKYFYNYLKK